MAVIDTDGLSQRLREMSIRPETRQLLISRIEGSGQEADLTEPPNCDGYGRIRHFRSKTPAPWPSNPLPILPASRSLALAPVAAMTAQVFQNASCNWRCWYCFVPFNLLSANEARASWLSAEELVALYLRQDNPPVIIDCSGGQPDLVPEWVPWMMSSLQRRGLSDSVYLWSDDNLSNDYFWRHLTSADLHLVQGYRNYGRVCCFKGFSATSFAFNTNADPRLFERQFELFARLLRLGIDLYAYATFTAPDDGAITRDMADFVDRLQEIHPNLPLRLVPLRIEPFGVVAPRMRLVHQRALVVQDQAVDAWNAELRARFDDRARRMSISDVPINS